MRFEVESEAVARAAGATERALDELSRSRVGQELVALVQAVPGGVTASGVAPLRIAWEERLAAARAALRSLGDGLATVARTYDELEASTRSAFGASGGRAGDSSGATGADLQEGGAR